MAIDTPVKTVGTQVLMEFPKGEFVRDMNPHCDDPMCEHLVVLTNRRLFTIHVFTKEIVEQVTAH